MKTRVNRFVVPAVVVLLLVLLVSPLYAQWSPAPGTRISIVWPQDGSGHQTPVWASHAVNVSIWPTGAVGCSSNPGVQLMMCTNNEPAAPVGGPGQTMLRTVGSVTFPSDEFNNIPANLAANPTYKYRFVAFGPASTTGQGFTGNVWVHATDARTIYPNPVAATGYAAGTPSALDARIQIVWPHDYWGNYAPVQRATRVNIAVEVFAHGTTSAIPKDQSGNFPYTVGLWMSEQNSWLHVPESYNLNPATYSAVGQTFTRWVFNNVPVVPYHQYHFVAGVTPAGSSNVSPYATIWTHAVDARTYAPNPLAPAACVP